MFVGDQTWRRLQVLQATSVWHRAVLVLPRRSVIQSQPRQRPLGQLSLLLPISVVACLSGRPASDRDGRRRPWHSPAVQAVSSVRRQCPEAAPRSSCCLSRSSTRSSGLCASSTSVCNTYRATHATTRGRAPTSSTSADSCRRTRTRWRPSSPSCRQSRRRFDGSASPFTSSRRPSYRSSRLRPRPAAVLQGPRRTCRPWRTVTDNEALYRINRRHKRQPQLRRRRRRRNHLLPVQRRLPPPVRRRQQ